MNLATVVDLFSSELGSHVVTERPASPGVLCGLDSLLGDRSEGTGLPPRVLRRLASALQGAAREGPEVLGY